MIRAHSETYETISFILYRKVHLFHIKDHLHEYLE